MVAAQLAVIALLFLWDRAGYAAVIVVLLTGQVLMMACLLRRPEQLDVWYNAAGVPLYVLGMLVSALAVRTLP
jgi:chlorophyll synthase